MTVPRVSTEYSGDTENQLAGPGARATAVDSRTANINPSELKADSQKWLSHLALNKKVGPLLGNKGPEWRVSICQCRFHTDAWGHPS